MATEASVYVHVPFCERLCPYCDFAVSVQVDIPHEEYGQAICDELKIRQGEISDDYRVSTIYFGGGTPSLLAPSVLAKIIDQVGQLFVVADDVEITIEANPNQVSDKNLVAWRQIGINRLSLGCQSFSDRHLHRLRRNHSAEEALAAAKRALSAMERVSIDLMFAGPDQPLGEWRQDLATMQHLVNDAGLDHVSAYNLTIEPGTTFAIRQRQGALTVPGDDQAAQMLSELVEACQAVGLARYEVSNFAAPEAISRHNSGYWVGRPYLGVGVGAHGLEVLDGGVALRRANPKNYDQYMRARRQEATKERLAPTIHLGERLFLGARTTLGIDLAQLRAQFHRLEAPIFERAKRRLDDLVDRGWMSAEGAEKYSPTNRGLNFSDSLANWLYDLIEPPASDSAG